MHLIHERNRRLCSGRLSTHDKLLLYVYCIKYCRATPSNHAPRNKERFLRVRNWLISRESVTYTRYSSSHVILTFDRARSIPLRAVPLNTSNGGACLAVVDECTIWVVRPTFWLSAEVTSSAFTRRPCELLHGFDTKCLPCLVCRPR